MYYKNGLVKISECGSSISRCLLVRGNAQEMEDMIPLILALLAIAIVALFLKVSACRDLLLK